MNLYITSCLVVLAVLGISQADDYRPKYPVLRSFKNYVNDFEWNPDGVYRFVYHAGDSYRSEQRTASGEVAGTFEFLAPEGEEYKFKYEADKTGYYVDSDALPKAPEETDEVKLAREAFFEAYKEAALRADEEEYSYGHEYNADTNDQSVVTYKRPSYQSTSYNSRPQQSRRPYQSAYDEPAYNSGYAYNRNYVEERPPVEVSEQEDYRYKQEEPQYEEEEEEEEDEEEDDEDDDDDDDDDSDESSEESSEEDDDNDLANYAAFSHFGVRLNSYDSDEDDDDSSSSESDEDDDDDDDDDDDEDEEEEDEEQQENKASERGYYPRRRLVRVNKKPLSNAYNHFGRRTVVRRRRI